jgi:hypothetical protein
LAGLQEENKMNKKWDFNRAAASVAANAEHQNSRISKRLAKSKSAKPVSAKVAPQVGDGLNDLRNALTFNRKAVS